MTIYHRLKVWAIKGYRAARYGFLFVRPRTLNMIWLVPVLKRCDYCGETRKCITMECDLEVVASICGSCLQDASQVLSEPLDTAATAPSLVPHKDHRGVLM